ncbi:hypothetical protein OBBRIDRAFT_731975, partial [Obba rivulosa]
PSLEASNIKNLTHPDNIFGTKGFLERLISCSTLPNRQPSRADHFPIATTFNLELPAVKDTPRCNFRMVNWPDFRDALKSALQAKHLLTTISITDAVAFEQVRTDLMDTIANIVQEHVPLSKPSPYSKQ